MTTHLHLPVQSITAVRLVCRTCGAAVVIPPGAKDAPEKRFNCYRELPVPEIVRGLVRAHLAETDPHRSRRHFRHRC